MEMVCVCVDTTHLVWPNSCMLVLIVPVVQLD